MIVAGFVVALVALGTPCAAGYFPPGWITNCDWIAGFVALGFIFFTSGLALLFMDLKPERGERFAS